MSFKRYAIMAAISYHNNQQNSSTSTTVATTTTITKSISSSILTSSSSLSLPSSTAPQLSITTARTSLFTSSSTYGTSGAGAVGVSGGNSNIAFTSSSSNGSSFPAYGLSLFHQRSGSGNGVGNGGTAYQNGINGNVNLLLGGAMLSLVTTILCVVCYCCHRNIKKRTEAAYRQQRQWLESDPNMEIYSVEQCYETSGLFMGESTDGLSTLPTLHHEPPPSYDAVVAMHEQQLLQQQQQALLQQHQQLRLSPPPGYRSALDVNAIALATTTAGMGCGPATLCLPSHNSSGSINNNNNSSSNSVDNLNENLNNASCVTTRYNFAKQIGNRQNLVAHPLLNMKKLWNAQSCCSLQRAEVENMWNAAAAAVAARAGAATSATNTYAAETPESMQQQTTNFITRKSLPSYMLAAAATTTAAKLSVNQMGRRYLNQSQYRRGCPLCGKFRHDADADVDESLSLSTESGLDNLQSIVLNSNALGDIGSRERERMPQTTAIDGAISDEYDDYNNNNNNMEHGQSFTTDLPTPRDIELEMEAGAEEEECLCGTRTTATNHNEASSTTSTVQDYENGNIPMTTTTPTPTQVMSNNAEVVAAANHQNSPQIVIVDTDNAAAATDNNANSTLEAVEASSTSKSSAAAAISDGNNDNNNDENIEVVDLDSINENGIVRLDMSKIIDRTGLPTYEAALKLESSGYV